MCTQPQPSRSGGSNPVLLFDTIRQTLHHNHKFATGDISQVCDGRNWELARHAVEGEGKNGSLSEGEISDAVDEMKIRAISSYRPAGNGSCSIIGSDSSSDSSSHEQPFTSPMPAMTQTQDNMTPQCTGSKPLEEVAVEEEAVSRTKVPAKPENQSSTTTITRRPSWQDPHQHSNEDKPSSERRALERKTSRRLSGDSNNTESLPKPRSRISGRLSSSLSGSSSHQRPSIVDKVPRRSLSSNDRRRRSSEDKPSTKSERLAFKEEPPRRLSFDSDTTSSSPVSGSRVTVRQLSEPMHRCSTTNQNVLGIMRPARYSSNNLVAMASPTSDPPTVGQTKNNSTNVRRNASVGNNLSSMKTWTGRASAERVDGLDTINSGELMEGSQSADWIASGVDFSNSMEVYLFKT